MKRHHPDGRVFAGELMAEVRAEDDGTIAVLAPAVGLFRDGPAPGFLVGPEAPIGSLEVLGVIHRLYAPVGAAGRVVGRDGARLARRPVGFRDILFTLDPHGAENIAAGADADPDAASNSAGLQFRSPLSGRFYARPAPDQDTFVKVGDVITRGQTIALLEVMKTFNRLTFGGGDLPEKARVVAILARDEDDLEEGDPILDLEPA